MDTSTETGQKIFRVIVIIAIVVLIGYTFITSGYLDEIKKDSSTNEPTKTSNNNLIENNSLKEDLDEKIRIVNYSFGDEIHPNGFVSYWRNQEYKNLNDSNLLIGLIYYLKNNNREIITEITDRNIYNEYPNAIGYIDANLIKEKSLYYFNKDFSNIYSAPNNDKGNSDIWLSAIRKDNKYLLSTPGASSLSEYVYTYNYKYERNNKQAFVYTSVAIAILNEEGYTLFKDFDGREEVKVLTEDEVNTFTITNDDYNNYIKFKYTFDLIDGNYYFNKIEKI